MEAIITLFWHSVAANKYVGGKDLLAGNTDVRGSFHELLLSVGATWAQIKEKWSCKILQAIEVFSEFSFKYSSCSF